MNILFAAAALSLVAASAGAQQAPGASGRAEVNPDDAEKVFVTPGAADLLASRMIGASVTNRQDETIGEVEDLIVRDGNQLTGVVVGVGGFLGMGERHVVIDPSGIAFSADGDRWSATTDASREALEVAPEFEYDAEAVR